MRTSSEAYDMTQFAPEPRRQASVKVVKTENKAVQRKKSFRVKFVLYVLVLSLLMAGTVYSKTQLTETKARINRGYDTLTELENDSAYLNYRLENLVSLKNAEDYAVMELGFTKLNSSQVKYVNVHNSNAIETHQGDPGIVDTLSGMFHSVMEFFGG